MCLQFTCCHDGIGTCVPGHDSYSLIPLIRMYSKTNLERKFTNVIFKGVYHVASQREDMVYAEAYPVCI